MTLAQVIPFKPQAKPVADACRWSEAIELVAQNNLRICFAWQRMVLRSIWGL